MNVQVQDLNALMKCFQDPYREAQTKTCQAYSSPNLQRPDEINPKVTLGILD
jgi:hypothetical protein